MDNEPIQDSVFINYEKTRKIFCNPVILENLLQYLSVEDLKELRETSATINNEILKQKKFRKGTAFLISKENNVYSSAILDTSRVSWKNLKIELYKDIGTGVNDGILKCLLENDVECLNVFLGKRKYFRPKYCPLFEDAWGESENGNRFKHLTEILMPYNMLNIWKLQNIPFFGDNLKSVIFHTDHEKHFYSKWNCALLSDNLTLLADKCKSLKEFGTPRVVKPAGDAKQGANIRKQIIRLIDGNKETLTKLIILDETISGWPDFKFISCSSLTNLRINFSETNFENVANFIKISPQLQSLNLLCTHKILNSVIEVIKEKTHLKKLNIKSSKFEVTEWDFVKNFESLEYLKLVKIDFPQRRNNPENLSFLLLWNNLPKSLKTLIFRNFKTSLPPTIIEMKSFANLKQLSLVKCENILNDGLLQSFILHMPKLEKLHFSNCPTVTNFGLTGIPDPLSASTANAGVSIENLKLLRVLIIKSCPKITNKIIQFLSFQFLNKLNLGKNKSLTMHKSDVASIVLQNPNLRKLYFSKCSIPKYSRFKFSRLQETAVRSSNGRCTLVQLGGADSTQDSDEDSEAVMYSEAESNASTTEDEFTSEDSESEPYSPDLESLQVQLMEMRESLVRFQNRYLDIA